MADLSPREQILAKAGELFHKRGYGAVSVEDVIRFSGLPKAVFYQNFSTKTELGRVWLDRLNRRMAVFHRDFLERAAVREKRLRKYFLSMCSWVEANGFRSCQFANTAACIDGEADQELALLIDKYKREQMQFFIDLVKTLVDASEARRKGTQIFLLYSGAMTECQNLKATWPLEDALVLAEQICDI